MAFLFFARIFHGFSIRSLFFHMAQSLLHQTRDCISGVHVYTLFAVTIVQFNNSNFYFENKVMSWVADKLLCLDSPINTLCFVIVQAVHRHMPTLIRASGSCYSEFLRVISDPPQGSENLLMLVASLVSTS